MSTWNDRCDNCGKTATVGQVGVNIRLCSKCWDKWMQVDKVHILLAQLVQMDAEMESDGRVVNLRKLLEEQTRLKEEAVDKYARLIDFIDERSANSLLLREWFDSL